MDSIGSGSCSGDLLKGEECGKKKKRGGKCAAGSQRGKKEIGLERETGVRFSKGNVAAIHN